MKKSDWGVLALALSIFLWATVQFVMPLLPTASDASKKMELGIAGLAAFATLGATLVALCFGLRSQEEARQRAVGGARVAAALLKVQVSWVYSVTKTIHRALEESEGNADVVWGLLSDTFGKDGIGRITPIEASLLTSMLPLEDGCALKIASAQGHIQFIIESVDHWTEHWNGLSIDKKNDFSTRWKEAITAAHACMSVGKRVVDKAARPSL